MLFLEPNHPFGRSPTMQPQEERTHPALGPNVSHRCNLAVNHRGRKPYRPRAFDPTTQALLVRRQLERTTKTAPTNLPVRFICTDRHPRSSTSPLVRTTDNTNKIESLTRVSCAIMPFHDPGPVAGDATSSEERIFLRKYASQNSFINDASLKVTLPCSSSPLSKASKRR